MASRVLGHLLTSEHGARRFRLAGFTIGANVVSKSIAFAALIYSTKVALTHLGADRFGVWVTISSVATLLSFMDLGLSNALIKRVAELSASQKTSEQVPQVVTFGLIALSGVGVLAAILLAGLFALVPLSSWFKGISGDVVAEARLTGYVFALFFGLSLPAQGVYKIYAGLQCGWIAHTASGFGWMTSLVLVGFAPQIDAPMWFYLFATFGIQQLAGLVLVCGISRRGLLRWPTLAAMLILKRDALLQQGRMFLVIQVAVAIVWGSNQLILSAMIGPAEAAVFSVIQRLFMIVQVALAILNAPLWAMYAEAHAHRESIFIRGLLRRSMAISFMLSAMGVSILVLCRGPLLGLLVEGTIAVPPTAMVLMALWTLLEVSGNAFAMYLNGVGVIRPQAITGIAHVIMSVPMKMAAVYFFGLNGLLATMIFSYILFTALPFATYFRNECLMPLHKSRP